jgi:VWFA-related protein
MAWKSPLFIPPLLFSTASLFLHAQSGQGEPGWVLKMTSRSVIVDVVVDDGKGEPLPGLRKDQFQVLEDGKPQAVDFFEEHKASKVAAGALPPVTAMPPNVYSNVPPSPLSDSVNVLMLDTLNTPFQDFSYARNEVIQFLHNVTPGTRLAIVTLSDKLTFVTGFTTDVSTLLAAIEDKKSGVEPKTSTVLTSRGFEASANATTAMLSESGASGVSGNAAGAIASAFSEEEAYNARMRYLMTLEALQELSKHLASVPGRKNLLWFSSEFPMHVFPAIGQGKYTSTEIGNSDGMIGKTADALTAARIAVYPIDARGVIHSEVIQADSRGIDNTPNLDRVSSTDSMKPYAAESQKFAYQIISMNELARETGGKALYNSNDLNVQTQRAIADGAHYYTLAYTPANKKMDGRFRRIEVKLANPTFKLSFRQGYNADETGTPITEADAALLHNLIRPGVPAATEILYAARLVPSDPQPAANSPRAGKNAQLAGPLIRYSIDFFIRWTDLKFEAMPDGTHAGRIQLELLAYDRQGKELNWNGGTQQMALKPEVYGAVQKSGVPGHVEIDLPANQEILLETGVFDFQTGRAGTLEIPISGRAAK